MALGIPDVNSDDDSEGSLDEFCQALISPVARQRMGLAFDDERARVVAADPVLSRAWYALWRANARRRSGSGVPIDGAAWRFPAGKGGERVKRQPPRWETQLPVRFNRPPNWPQPDQDWILRHIGLEMTDEWRPPGAPASYPPGWVWWIPQEPAWSAWVNSHNGAALMQRPAATVFGVLLGLTMALSFAGWSPWLILAASCAFITGIGWVRIIAKVRHFRKDPLGELRDRHLQVAELLKTRGAVDDSPPLSIADLPDGGSWFDGD